MSTSLIIYFFEFMGYNFDSFAQMVVGPAAGPAAVPSFAVSPEALCYFVVECLPG
jgi:hypothetical protein